MQIIDSVQLDFSDVLIKPRRSSIDSRSKVNIKFLPLKLSLAKANALIADVNRPMIVGGNTKIQVHTNAIGILGNLLPLNI